MQVTVLEKTSNPERLVCQGARGDYFDGYVGDTAYTELMEGVQYSDHDVEMVKELRPEWEEHDAQWLENEAKTYSLIRKLIKRGHWGPWEAPQISFSIGGVSRVVMAQITRHRHLSFDVQSMRYVDFSDKEPVVPPVLTGDSEVSRELGLVELDQETRASLEQKYLDNFKQDVELYHEMVDAGIPKEAARYVLPTGTPVNMTMSGNVRTMFHVLVLRDKPDVQPETRILAGKLAEELEAWVPYSATLFEEAGPYRPSP